MKVSIVIEKYGRELNFNTKTIILHDFSSTKCNFSGKYLEDIWKCWSKFARIKLVNLSLADLILDKYQHLSFQLTRKLLLEVLIPLNNYSLLNRSSTRRLVWHHAEI